MMIALVCLALLSAPALGQPLLSETRTQYELLLKTGPFRGGGGNHLAGAAAVYAFLEELSEDPTVDFSVEPLDATHLIEEHYKLRDRTFYDTASGYYAKHGIVLSIDNACKNNDCSKSSAKTRCQTKGVTLKGQYDPNDEESQACWPEDDISSSKFEGIKTRVEEDVSGFCQTESIFMGQQHWKNQFQFFSTVADVQERFPNLPTLGLTETDLVETSHLFHMRLDDIAGCVGSHCTHTATSAEWFAAQDPNVRARLEIGADDVYVYDSDGGLGVDHVVEASFKIQLSNLQPKIHQVNYGNTTTVGWAAHKKAENVWSENFLNGNSAAGDFPFSQPLLMLNCMNRGFHPTTDEPDLS